jgi:flagellar biosynthesis protein FliR
MITFTSQQLDLWIGTFLWPFCRILALLTAAPVLNHRVIPVRVKVAFALLLAFAIGPSLPASPPVALASAAAIGTLIQQTMIGLAIGFSMSLVFSAMEMAGDLIGLQMGLSFATFVDPQSSSQTPLIGSFLGVFAMLTFLIIDGHLTLIALLAESFHALPVGADIQGVINWEKLSLWGTEVFTIGLHLALPVIATILLSNIALGVLTRAAPQLNIFAVGFPLTLLLGFVILWLAMPHFGAFFEQTLARGATLLLN